MARFIRRAICGAIDCPGATSSSRLSPSGVSSNTHENTRVGTKPIARRMTMLRGNQSGAPNIGSTVPATCTSNHAPTRYSPAKRMTLRRLSSLTSDILVRWCGIGAAFEICLADRPASGGPTLLTPIRRETEAHDHCLDARIAQHHVAHRPAAIKINKVVLLRYRSERLDVGVVTVYVPPSDEEIGRFARWSVRDRRTQFDWIDVRLGGT